MSGDGRNTDWGALEAVLDTLLELAPDARVAALDILQRDDPQAAAHLRTWLAQIDASDGFLVAPVSALQPGQRLGPWQLVVPIGRGGMGEVWRGTRADGAFTRDVAIKLLRHDRPGSPAQLARERELLARLRHPGIAQLLDGGITEGAQPYLVTEWVDGVTLDAWLRAAPRALADRVDMLRRIAEAVAFAHANLIVHRDLKPANVMVDSSGAPRLLDFGIARLVDHDLQRADTSDRALTPGFAAPEQVRGEAFTTRTDVHGLGALLYWLLTGSAPHAGEGDSLARWVERITREPVAAPSMRSTLAIDADLDAIVLTALAADPDARYASADAFVLDLQRWSRGDAVSARLPTRFERLRRFVRRNRGGVAAAGLLLVAITAGVLATRVQQLAAEREAARATAVKDFLVQLFRSIEPEAAKGEPVLVDTLIAQGERDLPESLADQPALQFEMLGLLAGMRLSLGQQEQRLHDTERQCPIGRSAFGDDSPEYIGCLNELADAYRVATRLDEARSTLDTALSAARRLRADDPLPLSTALRVEFMLQRDRGELADAEAAIDEAIAIGRAAEHGIGPVTAFMLEDRAVFLQAQGRRPEAIPLLEEIVAYDTQHADTRPVESQINSRWNLLAAFWGGEQFLRVVDESEAMAAFTAEKLGGNHPHWYRFMQLRAIAQGRLGRYLDAVATLREALAVPGIDAWEHGRHRLVLGSELIAMLAFTGEHAAAMALATDLLALADANQLAAGSAFVAAHNGALAALYAREAASIAHWTTELDRRFAVLPTAEQAGRGKPLRHWRATAARVAGDTRAAIALLAEVEREYRPADGGSNLLVERAIAEQGFALADLGDAAHAAERLRAARALLVTRLGESHIAVAQIDHVLATLPDTVSTADERARTTAADARFHAATGRPLDTLRLL